MAAWKPRPKALTPEEALASARKEAAPLWFGAPPLVASYPIGGNQRVFALDPEFDRKVWVIALRDLTAASGTASLAVLKELHRRYSEYGVGVLLVLATPYSFLRERDSVEALLRRQRLPFPVVLDPQGRLAQALGSSTGVSAGANEDTLLYRGQQTWRPPTPSSWALELDRSLQKLLRQGDPGLPLPPLYDSAPPPVRDLGRISFGKSSQPAAVEYELSGIWWCDGDRLGTSDPRAAIRFRSPGAQLAVVARSANRSAFHTKSIIELDGVPAATTFLGPDMGTDETGSPALKIEDPRPYHALTAVPPTLRETTLRFPAADRSPVLLYGVSFWD
jgi:hypothetical protein